LSQPITAVLLLTCPDQRGLVASVSDFIYRNGGNIIHADQHTDQEQGIFLQRVEWELTQFAIPREEIASAFTPIADRFGMRWQLRFSDRQPKVAVLVSRELHCLQDLLARWSIGELPGDLRLIVSNHRDARDVTERSGLEFRHYPMTQQNKRQQEAQILEAMRIAEIDLVVLARYMQVLSPQFVACYPNGIINIHHSFLPAFLGNRPYHQAYERGVKIIGATAHYATDELDQGPIIEQDVARISHRDTVEDLVRKGRDLEKMVLARAVRAHLLNRVLVYGNRTVVFE
jgi:formyltetrahydrofolate deformylase